MADGINGQFEKVSGKDNLLPKWDTNAENNGQGFDIDTSKKSGGQ